MAEIHIFGNLMQGPLGDRIVLLLTFALTVMVDLTVAIEVAEPAGLLSDALIKSTASMIILGALHTTVLIGKSTYA